MWQKANCCFGIKPLLSYITPSCTSCSQLQTPSCIYTLLSIDYAKLFYFLDAVVNNLKPCKELQILLSESFQCILTKYMTVSTYSKYSYTLTDLIQSVCSGLWCEPHVFLPRGNFLHNMLRKHLGSIFITDTRQNHTLVTTLCRRGHQYIQSYTNANQISVLPLIIFPMHLQQTFPSVHISCALLFIAHVTALPC